MTLKICFIIPSVSSGGIEMYLLRYLRYLQDTENITVLVRSNQKGELYDEYKDTGVKLEFLPLGYLNPAKTWLHYQFYKNGNFDIICDFNANFAGIPMLLANFLKIRKRITFYRQGSDHFTASFIKKSVNKFMNRLVYKNASHILSNSQAGLDFFFPDRSITDRRFKVINNGVNLQDYVLTENKESIRRDLGIPLDAYVIGHVGRLDKAKNHETILKVFKEFQVNNLDVCLVLCGRNTEQLKSRIVELEISDNTIILGYRKDVPRVLKSLDCFLFPSLTEGQPNALIEAMVADVPIVASNISSIKECVPSELRKNLKDPLDILGLTNGIIRLKSATHYQGVSDQAKKMFDREINFKKFQEIIYE